MDTIQPRILRFSQAYGYLGMCRDEFNRTVRPHVREFPVGKQGIGFDRLELDAWADAYIERMAIEKSNREPVPSHKPASTGRKRKAGRTPPPPSAEASQVEFARALEMVKRQK